MKRWSMLAVAMFAQVAGTIFGNAPAFLIPYLHLERGLSLTHAGLLAASPLVGTMVSLVAWGWLVDHVGERVCLAGGLVVVAVAAFVAFLVRGDLALAAAWFVGGVGAASTNSASGRLVIGWFPPEQRGTAMGIRQTALPIGVGIAAVLVPQLTAHAGVSPTMLVIAGICAVAAVAVWVGVADPPRTAAGEGFAAAVNPYRGDRRLARIHAASILLVVPQFTVWTFMLLWLVDGRGWGSLAAGLLVGATQLLGAAARVGAGWWSDRVGNRLAPMRWIAIAAAATMLALGLAERSPAGIALMIVATAVTVADNGLAFTAVAEIAGPFWAGRAMGLQNTGQYLASSAVPPLVGAAIGAHGYGWAFGTVAIFPLLAIGIIPVRRRAIG